MLIRQLRPTVTQFVGLYGGQPGEDFQATVNQALFFGNGTIVDSLIKPTNDNLATRLGQIDDGSQVADQLYLAILSRPATDEERRDVTSTLQDAQEQPMQALPSSCGRYCRARNSDSTIDGEIRGTES